MTKSVLTIAANHNKANHKMVGSNFLRLTQNKSTFFTNFIYDRFVKELIKVFFTLLLKLQFVDIVKCV